MYKFYFRLLIAFIIFVFTLNISLTLINLNPRQFINFAFYDTRVLALGYLAKDIIVETGINIHFTDTTDLIADVKEATKLYNINEKLLLLLVNPHNEYKISLTGGMGVTQINPYTFMQSKYAHPFIAKDNIFATAEEIRKLLNNGIHESDIPRVLLTKNLNYDTIRKVSPYINNMIIVLTDEYNKIIKNSDDELKDINIFKLDNDIKVRQ